MKLALSGHGDRFFDITVEEVREHNPQLISAVVEIDLMTFSEVTWSRYTAGLMLRHGRTFLLRADGAIIGTCQLLRSWAEPSEAVLFSMSIRPGWRGRGLGTYFLDEVTQALIASNIQALVLEVDPRNEAAIRLYEKKFGFIREQICQEEYGKGQDRLHMRKVFQAPTKGSIKDPTPDDQANPLMPS